MFELRSYQNAAILALFQYWHAGGGNPLIEHPTGCGKSLEVAELSRRFYLKGRRSLILSHSREIIEQDCEAFQQIWPDMPPGILGINAAALGQRDTDAPILLAMVQSIFRKPHLLGDRTTVTIDEVHRVPPGEHGMYHKTLDGLRLIHPTLRVAGFSATCYRLDSGRLDEGDDRLFDKVVHSYPISQAIKDGWLLPFVAKGTEAEIDVSDVHIRGGEFIPGELEYAADQEDLVARAVDEIIHHGENRRAWLLFCCGIKHAQHVGEVLRQCGVPCATVMADTTDKDRRNIVADFRAGRLRAVTNCEVFTTGFNVPGIDLIAMLRPTLSTGLYVQMCGRGTRKAEGKRNALLLDFAGNVKRHGPIDAVNPNNKGTPQVKECPKCHSLVAPGTRVCPDCCYEWPKPKPTVRERKTGHAGSADVSSPLSDDTTWLRVRSVGCSEHFKPGKPPSLRIDVYTSSMKVSEWLAFEHGGFASRFAADKWIKLGGHHPIPKTAHEAVVRRDELYLLTHIGVRRDGDYWRMVAFRKQTSEAAE